jgi:predicted acylesterase/phospholipase RssA
MGVRVGLVLAGGMAKGAYEVGVLKALTNFIPKKAITHLSCASIGVLNGYAFDQGKLDAAEEMWKELCIEDKRLFISQVLRSCMLQEDIKNIYVPDSRPNRNFYISLLNYSKMKITYKNLRREDPENILPYLRASVSMPIYNQSVKIDGNRYFDGAMIDNIPIFPLMTKKLDYIICVYFDTYSYRFESKNFDSKIIHITFPDDAFVKHSVVFTKNHIQNMITRGYDRTSYLLKNVIGNDYTDIEAIRNGIMNRDDDIRVRITGEVLTTGLNKLSQKLLRKDVR